MDPNDENENKQSVTDNQNNVNDNTPAPDVAKLLAEIESLKNHNALLLNEKKTEQQRKKDALAEKERLEAEQARKNGDVEAITKQYETKVAELQNELARRDAAQEKALIDKTALDIASQLTDNTNNRDIIATLINNRFKVVDGQIKVLNADGEISINDLNAFKNELITSGKYDSLISGTKATGVGSTGAKGTINKTELTEKERAELLRTDPTRFYQLFPKKN